MGIGIHRGAYKSLVYDEAERNSEQERIPTPLPQNSQIDIKCISGLVLGWMLALFSPSRAIAAPFAYVVNQLSDNVSVIDIATDMVVATIPVGDEPSTVAITPDGKKAYVPNYQSLSVSVIDIATNTVSATTRMPQTPLRAAAS